MNLKVNGFSKRINTDCNNSTDFWIYKMIFVSWKETNKLHLQLGPYHVSINSLNFSYECSDFTFSGSLFQICGPRHIMLLLPNLTVFLFGISRSFVGFFLQIITEIFFPFLQIEFPWNLNGLIASIRQLLDKAMADIEIYSFERSFIIHKFNSYN